MARILLYSALVALLAGPAQAQSVKLEIRDGRVNLDAVSAPARVILAEWARVGGTKIVGAEKITGAPLTLKLVETPERQALDIILRAVAGYMAAPRLASATPGASSYDRILILPTAAAPATAANAATTPLRMPSNPGPMAGERRLPPRPPGLQPPADDVAEIQNEATDTADTGVPQPPVFTFPQPGNAAFAPGQNGPNPFGVPGQNGFGVPAQPGAFGVPIQPGQPPAFTLQPAPNGQPMIYNFVPNNGTQPPTTGFGVIGAPTPGMIQQPAPAPGQPVQQRPPGKN